MKPSRFVGYIRPLAYLRQMDAQVDWSTYFVAIGGLAGTVFAIVLAVRPLAVNLQREHAGLRLADRVEAAAVTFELAAATIFAFAFLIRGSWLATVVTVVPALAGCFLIGWRAVVHWQVWKHDRALLRRQDHLSTWMHLLPLSAYVMGAVWPHTTIPVDWYGLSTSWLVLSGILQAVLWFLVAWDDSLQEHGRDA